MMKRYLALLLMVMLFISALPQSKAGSLADEDDTSKYAPILVWVDDTVELDGMIEDYHDPVQWKSSDQSVAKVSAGRLDAISEGITTISVLKKDGQPLMSFDVYVAKPYMNIIKGQYCKNLGITAFAELDSAAKQAKFAALLYKDFEAVTKLQRDDLHLAFTNWMVERALLFDEIYIGSYNTNVILVIFTDGYGTALDMRYDTSNDVYVVYFGQIPESEAAAGLQAVDVELFKKYFAMTGKEILVSED